ncbi:hypothetical protein EGW08_015772, partial [Elysia chlorotica]
RGEDAPRLGQLVRPDKVDLGPHEHVQDETFVGVRHLHYKAHFIAAAVGEIQLALLTVDAHAGSLGHHLHVDGLAGLHADHQLVALHLAVSEDIACDIPELYPHLRLPFV